MEDLSEKCDIIEICETSVCKEWFHCKSCACFPDSQNPRSPKLSLKSVVTERKSFEGRLVLSLDDIFLTLLKKKNDYGKVIKIPKELYRNVLKEKVKSEAFKYYIKLKENYTKKFEIINIQIRQSDHIWYMASLSNTHLNG